jgi:general secretion pathway protein J
MKEKINKNYGFTLLELLIAMVIFSIMSLMAYGGLMNMLNSNEATKAYDKDLKSLQRTMMFIERDLRQLVPRPRRVDYTSMAAALTSGLDADGIVEFTRGGNPNPANQLRSALQRIQYDLDEKRLLRKSWNLVDHVGAEPITMPLLTRVESLNLRFLGKDNEWQENWGAKEQQSILPKAIELTLEHERWGKIIRVIPVQ